MAPETTTQTAPSDWRSYITEDLKTDPVVSSWAEKASEKDIPAILKGYAHASKRMGSAINLPGKDAKPEDVQALQTRLREAGVMPQIPKDPTGYGLEQPGTLPEGITWSKELSGKFASTLHKHGISADAVKELLPLYLEGMQGSAATLQTNMKDAEAALRAEHGEQYEARSEMAKRMMSGIVKTPEELQFLEDSGLANHPGFLSVLLRLAPLAMQDSSFIESIPRAGGEISGDEAMKEYQDIMTNPQNKMHAGYLAGDKKVDEHINELYRRAYGTEAGKKDGITLAMGTR